MFPAIVRGLKPASVMQLCLYFAALDARMERASATSNTTNSMSDWEEL
jgi:hypothetical protein